MARIGILTCSNATQELGCSSVVCLADMRKRRGAFAAYPEEEKLTLIGILSCAGCPTLTGPDKLLQRIRGLTEFGVDTIHLSYCMKALCPYRSMYKKAMEEAFPNIRVVIGTHAEAGSPEEFRNRVKKLFCQDRKSMVEIIRDRDKKTY